MTRVGPFLKCFGSKWSAARRGNYPEPEHWRIVEPFAGGAGYSCAFSDRQVVLYDSHPEVRALWNWLIYCANEAAIREIPIFSPGESLTAAGLNTGQVLLARWWQRTNNHQTKTDLASPWCNLPGQWTANTRARIAEEVEAIKHWRVFEAPIALKRVSESTIFCDPSYQYNYQYGQLPIFYDVLANSLKAAARNGNQVIACEAVGKRGEIPNYLPFAPSHAQVTARRKAHQSHHSKELIWISERQSQ